jgi:Curli production assembly/transport component CsgG
MTDQIRHLLGGYATGTLTPEENEALLRAALDDQELFDALADDEALRRYLADPSFRQDLLKATAPRKSKLAGLGWIAALGAAAAGLTIAVLWMNHPKDTSSVALHIQAPTAPRPAVLPTPELAQQKKRPQPAPVAAPKAVMSLPAPRKLKVAVLDFDSGSSKPEVGQNVSNLIADNLAAGGVFTVIGRDEVQAVMRQALATPPPNPKAAAEIGRQLGADAVIVGQVRPPAPPAAGAVSAFAPRAAARSVAGGLAVPAVSARMIDSASGESLRSVNATAPSADINAAAQQISTALEKPLSAKITDVNAAILTLDAGSQAGVKTGDRLTVLHEGSAIGAVVITTSEQSFSVGRYTGTTPPQIGDIATTAPQK